MLSLGRLILADTCPSLFYAKCLCSSRFVEQNIRILHGCEVRIVKFVRGSQFGQSLVMPNSDPEGRIFLSAPNNHDRFFSYIPFDLQRLKIIHVRA